MNPSLWHTFRRFCRTRSSRWPSLRSLLISGKSEKRYILLAFCFVCVSFCFQRLFVIVFVPLLLFSLLRLNLVDGSHILSCFLNQPSAPIKRLTAPPGSSQLAPAAATPSPAPTQPQQKQQQQQQQTQQQQLASSGGPLSLSALSTSAAPASQPQPQQMLVPGLSASVTASTASSVAKRSAGTSAAVSGATTAAPAVPASAATAATVGHSSMSQQQQQQTYSQKSPGAGNAASTASAPHYTVASLRAAASDLDISPLSPEPSASYSARDRSRGRSRSPGRTSSAAHFSSQASVRTGSPLKQQFERYGTGLSGHHQQQQHGGGGSGVSVLESAQTAALLSALRAATAENQQLSSKLGQVEEELGAVAEERNVLHRLAVRCVFAYSNFFPLFSPSVVVPLAFCITSLGEYIAPSCSIAIVSLSVLLVISLYVDVRLL